MHQFDPMLRTGCTKEWFTGACIASDVCDCTSSAVRHQQAASHSTGTNGAPCSRYANMWCGPQLPSASPRVVTVRRLIVQCVVTFANANRSMNVPGLMKRCIPQGYQPWYHCMVICHEVTLSVVGRLGIRTVALLATFTYYVKFLPNLMKALFYFL